MPLRKYKKLEPGDKTEWEDLVEGSFIDGAEIDGLREYRNAAFDMPDTTQVLYSDRDLNLIGDLIDIKNPPPIDDLRQRSEEYSFFAATVKLGHVDKPAGARKKQFEKQILDPVRKLLGVLDEPYSDAFKELLPHLNEYAGFDTDSLSDQLHSLREWSEKHLDYLSELSVRGKRSDTELKLQLIGLAETFIQHFNFDFEPSREVSEKQIGGSFVEIVKILTSPLIGEQARLEHTIREYVDFWNQDKIRLLEEAGLLSDYYGESPPDKT